MPPESIRLNWPAADGARRYRVAVRDVDAGTFVHKGICDEPTYDLPLGELDTTRHYQWKVQIDRTGSWEEWQRYRDLDLPGHEPAALSSAASCPPSSLPASRPAVEPRAPAKPSPQPVGDLLFLYTVDTEASIRRMYPPDYARAVDQHVFGKFSGGEYGIGLMMDVLDEAGFKGTFFVDILMHYQFGREALERTVAAIVDRGHDVQLHLHPNPHLYYVSDPKLKSCVQSMSTQQSDVFARVFDLAVNCFVEVVGRPPVAYRAGSYEIQPAAFRLMEQYGIRMDSSIYGFKHCGVPAWMQVRTQPFWIGDVLEIPVSWMIDQRPERLQANQFNLRVRLQPAVQPAMAAHTCSTATPRALVFVAHSFTLLEEKRSTEQAAYDAWNNTFRAMTTDERYQLFFQGPPRPFVTYEGPNHSRIAMLEHVVQQATAQPGVHGISFQELHDHWLDKLGRGPGPVDPLPVWHAKSRCMTLTGTRRYSASYLEHLENTAAQNAAPAGEVEA